MDKTDFKWQADRFDDIKVLRYQVPGFEKLTLRQKKLVYYLSEAALCGRDILFDQNFKYNLRIRKVLEAIYKEYKGDRSVPEFAAFEKYLKKVWFANGIHHHYSNEKFQPEFSENYFRELVGAVPSLQHEKENVLGLIPVLFDKELYALRVSQEQEGDMVVASANNYYEGVTQREVNNFTARCFLLMTVNRFPWG